MAEYFHLTLCRTSAVLHRVTARGTWRELCAVQAENALAVIAQLTHELKPQMSGASAQKATYGQFLTARGLFVTCANNLSQHLVVEPSAAVRNLAELKNLVRAKAQATLDVNADAAVSADWRVACAQRPFAASSLPRRVLQALENLAQQHAWPLQHVGTVWNWHAPAQQRKSYALCDGSSLGVALYDEKTACLLALAHYPWPPENAQQNGLQNNLQNALQNLALLQGAGLPSALPAFGVNAHSPTWLRFQTHNRTQPAALNDKKTEAQILATWLQSQTRAGTLPTLAKGLNFAPALRTFNHAKIFGVVACGLALAALMWGAQRVQSLRQTQFEQAQVLEQTAAKIKALEKRKLAPQADTSIKLSAAELAQRGALKQVAQQFEFPWLATLNAMGQALKNTPQAVALLSFEAKENAGTHKVVLTVEAKTSADALAFLAQLKNQALLSEAVATRHELQAQSPGQPVRVVIEANATPTVSQKIEVKK